MFHNVRESERKLERSRAELAASRARIVAAADETRRQIERDLHDGVQQRLVSLALAQRNAEAIVPPELHELRRNCREWWTDWRARWRNCRRSRAAFTRRSSRRAASRPR